MHKLVIIKKMKIILNLVFRQVKELIVKRFKVQFCQTYWKMNKIKSTSQFLKKICKNQTKKIMKIQPRICLNKSTINIKCLIKSKNL